MSKQSPNLLGLGGLGYGPVFSTPFGPSLGLGPVFGTPFGPSLGLGPVSVHLGHGPVRS